MTETFEYCHGFYDPMAEYMEQPCHGRLTTKIFEGCHDPTSGQVEKFCSGNGGLYVCSKYHTSHHNLLSLSPSFLIKSDEGAQSLDHLLDWLHWKS